MKKDKKPYNPAAYPLFGIRLSPHPLQFIVMSHLRVQFVLHLLEDRSKLFQRSLAAIDAAGGVEGID